MSRQITRRGLFGLVGALAVAAAVSPVAALPLPLASGGSVEDHPYIVGDTAVECWQPSIPEGTIVLRYGEQGEVEPIRKTVAGWQAELGPVAMSFAAQYGRPPSSAQWGVSVWDIDHEWGA